MMLRALARSLSCAQCHRGADFKSTAAGGTLFARFDRVQVALLCKPSSAAIWQEFKNTGTNVLCAMQLKLTQGQRQ